MASNSMEQNVLGKSFQHLILTFILSIVSYVIIISINMNFTKSIPKITGDGSYLSNLGIVLWCVAATVCFFSAALLNKNKTKKISHFLLYSGLLTSYLLFDDFLQWHERLFPKILHIDEKIVFILLGIAALTLMIKFKDIILRTNYIVMLMGLFFLAMSIAGDGILNPIEIVYGVLVIAFLLSIYIFITYRSILKEYLLVLSTMIVGIGVAFAILQTNAEYADYLFEEGAKWLGIASWCSYYTHTAYQAILNSYEQK